MLDGKLLQSECKDWWPNTRIPSRDKRIAITVASRDAVIKLLYIEFRVVPNEIRLGLRYDTLNLTVETLYRKWYQSWTSLGSKKLKGGSLWENCEAKHDQHTAMITASTAVKIIHGVAISFQNENVSVSVRCMGILSSYPRGPSTAFSSQITVFIAGYYEIELHNLVTNTARQSQNRALTSIK